MLNLASGFGLFKILASQLVHAIISPLYNTKCSVPQPGTRHPRRLLGPVLRPSGSRWLPPPPEPGATFPISTSGTAGTRPRPSVIKCCPSREAQDIDTGAPRVSEDEAPFIHSAPSNRVPVLDGHTFPPFSILQISRGCVIRCGPVCPPTVPWITWSY